MLDTSYCIYAMQPVRFCNGLVRNSCCRCSHLRQHTRSCSRTSSCEYIRTGRRLSSTSRNQRNISPMQHIQSQQQRSNVSHAIVLVC